MYSSCASRGLELLVYFLWPKIKDKWPDATLHVFTNPNSSYCKRVGLDGDALIEAMYDSDGIVWFPRVSKERLAREWLSASWWRHSSWRVISPPPGAAPWWGTWRPSAV